MTNSEIRAQARQNLKGNWGLAIGSVLICLVILGVVMMIPMVGVIGMIVLVGPMTCGVCYIYLCFARARRTEIKDLFSGFQYFGNSFLAGLLVNLYTFLWSLLFVIPGIVKGYSYSMTYYILCDHPEMSGNEAIAKSRQLMDGHKLDLFVLQLTFIGWMLLGTITFGIAMLYVGPYMQEAEVIFYKNLVQKAGWEKPAIEESANS